MTINELKILLDIGNPGNVIESYAKNCGNGWLFVDSSNGQCYLFDKDGKEKDISCLTEIDDDLFYEDITLAKIVMPSSVTSIGYGAFYCCSNLTSVTIPDGVTSIGDCAFEGCSGLTSMAIPDSVTNIGNWAFTSCSRLMSMMIPDSVKSIGYKVFYNCRNLMNVTFKGKTFNKVKAMENYPFDIEDKSVIKCEV